MKIFWSPFSVKRLTEIAQYIERESKGNSIDFVNRVFESIDRVKDFPLSGRIIPETKSRNIREVMFESFRIIYRVDDARIVILTIRHVRQFLWEKNEI